MSQPTSPNRDLPFREVTLVRRGTVYRGVAVGHVALLETGTVATRGPERDNFPEAERGVSWIDGHHDYDSAEVKALLAAWALEDEKDRDQDPAATAEIEALREARRRMSVPYMNQPPLPDTHFPNVFDDED